MCTCTCGSKPNVKYFHIFGSVCYILTNREQRRKFDPKSDKLIFLGYSKNSRAYRVFNKRTKSMMESINVVIDDNPYVLETSLLMRMIVFLGLQMA